MSKRRKSPEVEYQLRDKLKTYEYLKEELELQMETKPSAELIKELSIVNYHIECTRNRLDCRFLNPIAQFTGQKAETHKTYTHA